MKTNDPTDISVIVVNWNTRELLRQCLESVAPVSARLKTEIIVIDNGSKDGSAEMVREFFPTVQLIVNGKNLGFAVANNQGLRQAAGRYLLLLNSDAVLLPGSLERVWESAEMHPQTGMVGCRVLNSDGSLQISCMRFPDFAGFLTSALMLPGIFPKCAFLGYEDLTWWNHNDEREVQVLKGCFILARAEAVREIGLLDEDFWLYGEDTDWCYRMRQASWEVRFTPCAEIIHHGGASTGRLPAAVMHQLWGAKLRFTRKHRSAVHHRACCGAVGLWFALRILPHLAAALLVKQRRHHHWHKASVCASGVLRLLSGGSASLVLPGSQRG
jgi:GT2 family glycosyltransferase